MKFILGTLLLLSMLYAQPPSSTELDESEEPDEDIYLELLLNKLFKQSEQEASNSRKMRSNEMILRQRVQYSPSVEGWRILNKGRFFNRLGNFIFVIEQDPGESKLNDHTILTWSSRTVPGVDELIVGDYHMSLGGGLLVNQQGYRFSMNPTSLLRKNRMRIRPHYSSRELNYYHGIAASRSNEFFKATAFASKRKAIGTYDSGVFREDSDGIHPIDKTLSTKAIRMAGLAMVYTLRGVQFYSASLLSGELAPELGYELGFTWNIIDNQALEVYTNDIRAGRGRSLLSWSYRSGSVNLALQYRSYNTELPLGQGAAYSVTSSSASNERGISFRLQLNLTKGVNLKYALDQGAAHHLQSLVDLTSVKDHRLQLKFWNRHRELRLDIGQKREGPIILPLEWTTVHSYQRISKMGLSYTRRITKSLQYRLNVKLAQRGRLASGLIQQRLILKREGWTGGVGFVRHRVPESQLRLSIYESSIEESFSFYTAFDDGQRWFIYLKRKANERINLEVKLAKSHSDDVHAIDKQLAYSFQMSIVI